MRNQVNGWKRVVSAFVVFSMIGLASACDPIASARDPIASLHPLYTLNDRVTDPNFAGQWVDEDGEPWMIAPDGDKAYLLSFGDKDVKEPLLILRLHLVKVGTFLFLDGRDTSQTGFCSVQLHVFGRIWIEKDQLRVAMLDDDWIEEQIEAGQLHIGHEKAERRIVLTAGTKQLQELAMQYAENQEAFSVLTVLKRTHPDNKK